MGTCSCCNISGSGCGYYDCGSAEKEIDDGDCEQGFYLSGTGSLASCQQCPNASFYTDAALSQTASVISGNVSSNNAITGIGGCFVTNNSSYYDNTGQFSLNSACFYSTDNEQEPVEDDEEEEDSGATQGSIPYQYCTQTQVQQKLKSLAAEQLSGMDADEINIYANLMTDYGMDSLGFVEMMLDVEDEFGIDINESDFVNKRTIAEITDVVLDRYC